MVSIFKDSRFRGRRVDLQVGRYPTIPIGNDEMSSVQVSPGYYAYLYRDTGYRGSKVVLFAGNYPNMPNWNDEVSSMEVFEYDAEVFPVVTFYQDSDFRGFAQNMSGLGQSTDYDMPFFKNDSISSLKVPEGTIVTLYKDSKFRGDSREFVAGEYPNLGVYGFNDQASSVKITRPELELVKIEYTNEQVIPSGNPIGISNTTVNRTDVAQETSISLDKQLGKTVTRSWSNSTLVGITVSTTSKVGVSKGPVSAEVSTTISSTLQNTFTIGETDSKNETSSYSNTVKVTIPPESIGEAKVTLTPEKYKVDATYTFKVKGTDKLIRQHATIEVDQFQSGEAEISSRPIS